MTVAAAVLAAALAALALGRFLLVRVTVAGWSMAPTLRPGDRVLVRRASARSVRRGDLVVFARPREEARSWMIKRVLAGPGDPVPRAEVPVLWGYREHVVPRGRFVVVGDNPADSYDSRQFGYVHAKGLLGVVVRPGRRPTGLTR
jgi:signal peptidase I